MAQTYTSSILSVSDSNTTTHDTSNVTSRDINILSAECRWRGINNTYTRTDYESDKNTISATLDAGIDGSFALSFPTPTGDTFRQNRVWVRSESHSDDWPLIRCKKVIRDGNANTVFTEPDFNMKVESHNDQFYHEDRFAGEYLDGNYVGDAITANLTNDYSSAIDVTIVAETTSSTDVQVTEKTTDPYVTQDVSGSYSGTLNDGSWSSWVTLNGLQEGVNEFSHGISGSQKADFEFTYNYEYIEAKPTHGTVSFYDSSADVWRECAVADPTDSVLNYNHVHVYNPSQGAWGVLDVVDVSNADAIKSHQFYDDTAGWLAPREYNTK